MSENNNNNNRQSITTQLAQRAREHIIQEVLVDSSDDGSQEARNRKQGEEKVQQDSSDGSLKAHHLQATSHRVFRGSRGGRQSTSSTSKQTGPNSSEMSSHRKQRVLSTTEDGPKGVGQDSSMKDPSDAGPRGPADVRNSQILYQIARNHAVQGVLSDEEDIEFELPTSPTKCSPSPRQAPFVEARNSQQDVRGVTTSDSDGVDDLELGAVKKATIKEGKGRSALDEKKDLGIVSSSQKGSSNDSPDSKRQRRRYEEKEVALSPPGNIKRNNESGLRTSNTMNDSSSGSKQRYKEKALANSPKGGSPHETSYASEMVMPSSSTKVPPSKQRANGKFAVMTTSGRVEILEEAAERDHISSTAEREESQPGAVRMRPSYNVGEEEEEFDDLIDSQAATQREGLPQQNGVNPLRDSTNLVEAFTVNDDEDKVLAEAEVFDTARERRRYRNLICFVVFLIIALVVTLSVTLPGRGEPQEPSQSPSESPSMKPSFSDDGLMSLLMEMSSDGGEALSIQGTQQYQAAQWLLSHPPGALDDYTGTRILQRYAMATMYFAMEGDSWRRRANWLNETENECNWFLESETPCNPQNEITDFVLRENFLRGTLPPEIHLLESANVLDLSFGDIGGSLPTQLGLMTNLQTLILSSNRITGTIPSREMSNMSKLEILALDGNELRCNRTTFYSSVLAVQNEPGPVFASEDFAGFESLLILNLANNPLGQDDEFTCVLSPNIGRLGPILQKLDLSGTHVRGWLPSEIFNLTNLRDLKLPLSLEQGGNFDLGRGIPTEIGRLTELLTFPDFRTYTSNITSGAFTLPSEIGTMSMLRELDLSFVDTLTGALPSEIGALGQLNFLSIHKTSVRDSWMNFVQGLGGALPTEIGRLTNLTSLDVSHTALKSSLPTEIGGCTNLRTLDAVSSYDFYGTLPSEIGLLTLLTYLDMAHTGLSGDLPTELNRLTNLQLLRLIYSDLVGSIEDLACYNETTPKIEHGGVLKNNVNCSCCIEYCTIVYVGPDLIPNEQCSSVGRPNN